MSEINVLKTADELRDPLLLTGFVMQRRAGRLGARTLAYLADQWNAEPLAKLEMTDFVNSSVVRPEIVWDRAHSELTWPELNVYLAKPDGCDRHLVLLVGMEPNYYWKRFVDLVAAYLDSLGVKSMVSLRARPGEVPHTRIPPIYVNSSDIDLELQFGVQTNASKYEGPTSIAGVLGAKLQTLSWKIADIAVVQPDYFPRMPNAQAMVTLIGLLDKSFGTQTEVEALRETAQEQRRTIDEGVSEDDGTWEEIHERETTYDEGLQRLEFLAPAEPQPHSQLSAEAAIEDVERLFRAEPDEEEEDIG